MSGNRKLLQAWVPRELQVELADRARAADRSLSAEVRQAVREHLKSSEAAGQGDPANDPRRSVRDVLQPA